MRLVEIASVPCACSGCYRAAAGHEDNVSK